LRAIFALKFSGILPITGLKRRRVQCAEGQYPNRISRFPLPLSGKPGNSSFRTSCR